HVGQYLSAAAGVPAVVSGWAAGLSLVLLLCTFSRGAWLGALVGLAALGLLARSRRLDGPSPGRLLVLGLALTMGVAAVAPGLVERVKVTGDREELGRAQRRELFRGVVAGIAARPMLGWGQNGFDTHYPRSRTQGGYYPREAHSSYLHLAFEAGLPALALYVALLVAALVSVRRDEPTDWVRVGAGASVVAGLTACLTATGLAYLQLDLPFWAVVLAWHSGSCQAPPGSWGSVLGRVVAAPVALTSALWIGVAVVDTTWRRDQSPERLATATRLMWFREDLWNDLGEGLELQGDLEAARKAYTRGLDVNPDQTRLRSSRARCRAKRGDLAGALADLEAALAADPRSEELLLNKALILLALRRPAGAIASLEMALETNQQYLSLNPDTYRRAAELLADLHGRAGEARKAARARQLAQQLAR
ncbi:MAG: O-antigen ligase family protein, partial [Candidatus Riflebacteria bacterium]|nr:O-antigen ligase family protein [Candidatus Riflebacteria bacterium]